MGLCLLSANGKVAIADFPMWTFDVNVDFSVLNSTREHK